MRISAWQMWIQWDNSIGVSWNIYIYIRIYTYMYVCMYVCMYVRTYVRMYVCIQLLGIKAAKKGISTHIDGIYNWI